MAQKKTYSFTVPQDATVQIVVANRYRPIGPAPPHPQAPPPTPPQPPAALPTPPQSSAPATLPHGPNMGIPGWPPRCFVGHPIYKANAALIVEPKSPEFVPLDVFSLSVTEIGTLISLGTEESCEFFRLDANNTTCDEEK
ncbi:hypothetical protein V6N13_105867 [Hibiscus sabdariffa]|uniref:Uncharacterized protein n=1 Tax=Hibiscus sabdariffa TaxID=183260 RepID=A0ABR2EZ10_9ROSI